MSDTPDIAIIDHPLDYEDLQTNLIPFNSPFFFIFSVYNFIQQTKN